MSKIDPKLFQAHEHALEREYEVCPKCGSELVHRNSKSGPFLGCANYPSCDYVRSLHQQDHSLDKELPGTECPECSATLVLRQGRYGLFVGCSRFPECQHMQSAAPQQQSAAISCPECKKGKLNKKQSRYGKSFYACDRYPTCKYVVNEEPVEQSCPDCGWGIIVKKKQASGEVLACPQKTCSYKRKA